jgi:intein/homing endonuclease
MDEKHGAIAAGLIDVDLFESPYNEIASRALAFRAKFKKAPGEAHLDDLFDHILSDPKSKKKHLYQSILGGIIEQAKSLNAPYVLSRVNEFTQLQNLQAAVLAAARRFPQGGEGTVPDVQNILHKALKFKAEALDAGTFLNDPVAALAFLNDDKKRFFALGIPELDRRQIGPTVGEAFAFMAPKGRGKCLVGESLVLLPDGRSIPIEQLVRDKEPEVIAFDDQARSFIKARVSRHIENGVKAIYRVRTKLGYEIRCTGNHPFFSEAGWIEASEMKPGKTRVAVPWRIAGLGQEKRSRAELRLLGYLISNGSLSRRDIGWSSHDPAIRADFEKCLEAFGDEASWSSSNECLIVGGRVRAYLEEQGLLCKKSSQKVLPDFVFRLSDNCIREFLDALFTCDLGVWKAQPIIEYCSASAPLVQGVRYLLQRIGIAGRYEKFDAKFRGKLLPGYAKLSISTSHNHIRFRQAFPLLGKKAVRLAAFEVRQKQMQWQNQRPINEEAFFDLVESVTPDGRALTYDISVPDYHSFVANGLVVHNTWFCIHAATKAMMQQARVVHISLEMPEDQLAQRYMQQLFAVAKRPDKFTQTSFELDELKRVTGFKSEERKPKLNLRDPEIHKKLVKRLGDWGSKFGRIVIKRFPTKALTIEQLEAYLDGLELTNGFIPDMLIVDYPKLMNLGSSPEFQRIALGEMFERLRGLCVRRNMAGVFPIQSNRKGESVKLVTGEHTGEDYTQGQTADFLITYNQTAREHAMGLARLYVDKARSDEDKFAVLIAQSYVSGQFCLESAYMPTSFWSMIKPDEADAE